MGIARKNVFARSIRAIWVCIAISTRERVGIYFNDWLWADGQLDDGYQCAEWVTKRKTGDN
jgi:hypothetical protein